MTTGSLMKVECIAKCSPWIIGQENQSLVFLERPFYVGFTVYFIYFTSIKRRWNQDT